MIFMKLEIRLESPFLMGPRTSEKESGLRLEFFFNLTGLGLCGIYFWQIGGGQ